MNERNSMVERQIQARGIEHPATLAALRRVPRDRFVPPEALGAAYEDAPLAIGHEQTISQPYIVAYMTAALDPRPTDRLLEIGTGSGYQAAVLGEIAREVYTVERIGPLATSAAALLGDLGYDNVHVRHADGYYGWAEKAPFDGILVAAAAESIPPPLLEQLKPGGRLILPLGRAGAAQELVVVDKHPNGAITTRPVMGVSFVPFRH